MDYALVPRRLQYAFMLQPTNGKRCIISGGWSIVCGLWSINEYLLSTMNNRHQAAHVLILVLFTSSVKNFNEKCTKKISFKKTE